MSQDRIAACVLWIAPAFEAVQSIYLGRSFEVTDAIMSDGRHEEPKPVSKVPDEVARLERMRLPDCISGCSGTVE